MWKKMNFALKLTVFRVVLIPLYLILFFAPEYPLQNWVACIVYAVSSITDFFDGYIARKYNQSSKLGAFLDPVADKILVAVVIISLLIKHADKGESLFLMVCAVIIIGREIIISSLREFMSGLNVSNAVAVQYIGKVKTAAQMFSLGFLIVYDDWFFIPTKEIGWILLFIASFLTVWSMIDYFKSALKALAENNIDIYK